MIEKLKKESELDDNHLSYEKTECDIFECGYFLIRNSILYFNSKCLNLAQVQENLEDDFVKEALNNVYIWNV